MGSHPYSPPMVPGARDMLEAFTAAERRLKEQQSVLAARAPARDTALYHDRPPRPSINPVGHRVRGASTKKRRSKSVRE